MNIKNIMKLTGLVLALLLSGPASAEYPEKPITLICWSSAGSGHDLMARMIARIGEEYLGQPIVVINKEGGSGKVAMSYVLGQKPDGYVIMTNTRSMTELFPDPNGRLSVNDFKYISNMVNDPFVLLVREDSPHQTLEQLIAYAKANPGQLTLGGYSTRSVDEGMVKDLEAAAGVDVNYIPYRGGSEPVIAVLGGHIDAAVANPSEMVANYQAGKFKVLALSTEKRFAPFDNVPTFTELGYPLVTVHWRGVMASNKVPDEIVMKLEDVLAKVVVNPEFIKFMENANMTNGYMPSQEYTKMVKMQTNL